MTQQTQLHTEAWRLLDIKVPQQEMLTEASALMHRYVDHRSKTSRGWKSLCLHGLGAALTQDATQYGHLTETEAPHTWTEIAPDCPVSKAFIERLPIKRLYRVRFMLLEPGGYILPHQDTKRKGFGPVNIALNNPEGCIFKFEHLAIVPFTAGGAFLLDVSNYHAVVNASREMRFHVIVHGSLDKSHPVWGFGTSE